MVLYAVFRAQNCNSWCRYYKPRMSEEAQESRTKYLRNFREQHIRKNSKTNTMEDLMYSLLF